jgi:C-terminal processing protease CtpA/Prc
MMNKASRVKYLGILILLLSACTSDTTPTVTETASPVPEPTETASVPVPGQSPFPPAEIINDEGGAVILTGDVEYTYPFFTTGVAEPIIILEDQAGFIDRDRNFIFPVESQVLGQITSDFFDSPFEYSLVLPSVPRGTVRDVDNNETVGEGVMVFAVAYWTNTWGDAYLERRDQSGGGWSSAYASTRVSDDRDHYLEVYGGQYLVYAPDDNQAFPSGFGQDRKLFTPDDPIVGVPLGWTLVNMDTDPFTFDRSREPFIPLLEPETLALTDFSDQSYTEAFDAMLAKFRTEYAFTEHKGIDWDALKDEIRPRFEEAERNRDETAYVLALRDFLWAIPDGHIGVDLSLLGSQIQDEIIGGIGMAIVELVDGRVLVNYVGEEDPADKAGILFGAEILEMNGKPISEAINQTIPWSSPFSTEHTRRLEQLNFVLRFPIGEEVNFRLVNPGEPPRSVQLITEFEVESFYVNSPSAEITGLELPVEFEQLESGFGYVVISDFFDNELLTIQLWERMMQDLNQFDLPGLIIDLRVNGGGNGYLADQMAAYFFDEELVSGNTAFYDDSIDEFYADPGDEDVLFPPREELRFHGPVVVIVGPSCASACEFFAYDLTLEDRATILGRYPTAGLGGSIEDFQMPEGIRVRFTIGRAVDPDGKIHVEGLGVQPEISVNLTEGSFYAEYRDGRDFLLEEAIKVISRMR